MTRATSASVRLFVYGSLRRGGRHHDELEAAGATFLGEAETVPGYRLEALGEYFALVPTGLGAPDVVTGELYEVPSCHLPVLDAFEGDAYIRSPVEIRRFAAVAAQPRHQDRTAEPRHRDRTAEPRHEDDALAEMEESLAYFKKAR